MHNFLDLFTQLKNVDFRDSLGLEELKKFHIDQKEFEELAARMIKEAGNDVSLKIGPVGFPYGTNTTEEKLAEIKKGLENGAGEFDFTNNIEFIKKGDWDAMLKELKTLVKAAGDITTKVIVETPKLTDEEIVKAAQIVLESGATFIKTGTGHFGATTLHHVQLINETVGGKLKIKAASGIRDLKTVEEMMANGVTRFGIGISGIRGIIEELGG